MISENKEELSIEGSFIKKAPPKPQPKTKEQIIPKETVVKKVQVEKK